MLAGRNSTGRPLAASDWLEAHHRAKLPERRAFCERLARLQPNRIVDIGCATGLWFAELDKVLPAGCEFIGLDSDSDALAEAETRSDSWGHKATFEQVDLAAPGFSPPASDVTLMFNVAGYLNDLDTLLGVLAERSRYTAIRQYDGAALRFGPIDDADRAQIEQALRASIASSQQIRHYDLDRLYEAVHRGPFKTVDVSFELYQRFAPFPPEFMDYYIGTLEWTLGMISDSAAAKLRAWSDGRTARAELPSYFFEVDLVGVVS